MLPTPSRAQDSFNDTLVGVGHGLSYPTHSYNNQLGSEIDPSAGDVDMIEDSVDISTANPSSSHLNDRVITAYIVLDTNVFDHYLDLLKQFVDDIGQVHDILPISFIVPGIVIRELDGQQKRKEHAPSLARAAAAASRWLASSGKSPLLIRVQREGETLRASGSWKKGWDTGDINDDCIVDCCQYLKDRLGADVALWTEDNLLKFRMESQDKAIRILKCPAGIKEADWTCQAAARAIGLPAALAEKFSDRKRAPPSSGDRHGFDASAVAGFFHVDRMEVDWVLSVDPRDSLHLDIIERLGEYLQELLQLVAPSEVQSRNPRSSVSIYALPFERKAFRDWTLSDCVQYLGPAGLRWLDSQDSTDHLTQFLTPTSQMSGYPVGRGKPGNTWTSAQWRAAMKSLREIARRVDRWDSPAVGEYLDKVRDIASAFNIALGTSGT